MRPAGQSTNEIGRLREDSLAGQQRWGEIAELLRGPRVVAIAAVEEGDERSRIDDGSPQRP
jgi:hypothetical protein